MAALPGIMTKSIAGLIMRPLAPAKFAGPAWQ
jgi:hypothetical protein